MEATWLTPPKKFKRAHSVGKVMTSIFWDYNNSSILCRRIEAATPGNRKKETRKTDSRCSALALL